MTKSAFVILLNGVSFIAFKLAEQFVTNRLIPEFRYDLILNVSGDNPSSTQFDTYAEDNGRVEKGLIDKEVGDVLFRNGKVPVWIDISVSKADRSTTTLRLLCAGRFSDEMKALYYHERGTGPFGIKSPDLPIDYKEGVKFKI